MKNKFTTLLIFASFCLVPTGNIFADDLNVYGYFSTNYEKGFNEAEGLDGENKMITKNSPGEFEYASFNLMMQQSFEEKYSIFINMKAENGEKIELQNFWGEYAYNQYINLRIGKIYRKFGLYNEILDAVPTYYGVEAPEIFMKGHLLLSRTTSFMIYGVADMFGGNLNYSLTTGNGESMSVAGNVPLGFDLNYSNSILKFGTSGYISGSEQVSDIKIDNGIKPNALSENGVLAWMDSDDFQVFGGYFELNKSGFTFQAAYWFSPHTAIRNATSTLALINNTNINENQRKRFVKDASEFKSNSELTTDDIDTDGSYDVSTYYVLLAYAFDTDMGEIAPYLRIQNYQNPEAIADRGWGGNEAGVSDNGTANLFAGGFIYRPVFQLAFKAEGTLVDYKYFGNASKEIDMRLSLSYTFGL